MGEGPVFDIDRPFTAGDSGWFGAPRPLVGAANAIQAEVSTQSAAQVALAHSTPDRLENLREEINSVNRELDNKMGKLRRLEQIEDDIMMGFTDMSFEAYKRRRELLMDDIDQLEDERFRLRNKYGDLKQDVEEGDLTPHEIEDGIEEPVEHALQSIGISKGPFINVVAPTGETTTITFSKVSISEEDIGMTRTQLEELGFQVGDVKALEV